MARTTSLDGPAAQSRRTRLANFAESLELLRTRRFGTFCFASLLSNLGTWAQQVAEPWLLLSIGASPFLIGLDSFAMSAPIWVLTVVGGALADLRDRRRVIAICQSIQMLCPTAIIVLLVMGSVHPWIVIALSLVVGITDALSMPSFRSIVPSIVPRGKIGPGLALNAMQFNISRVLGPALAGLLMASYGAIACFGASALSYLPFIWVALWILPHGRPSRPAGESDGRRRLDVRIRRVLRWPHLRGALLTVFFVSLLCGPVITFIPVLIKEMGYGAGEFSAALGAFGAGGLVGSLALLGVDATSDRRPMSSSFAVAYGVALVLVGLNPWNAALPVLLVGAGVTMSVANISADTLVQSTASPALRGQTVSLYMLAMRGGLALGSLLTGLSVEVLGVRQALLLNGVLAVILQLVVGRWWRKTPLPAPPVRDEQARGPRSEPDGTGRPEAGQRSFPI